MFSQELMDVYRQCIEEETCDFSEFIYMLVMEHGKEQAKVMLEFFVIFGGADLYDYCTDQSGKFDEEILPL